MGHSRAVVIGRGAKEDGIGSNRLRAATDIESWEGRFVVFVEEGADKGPCIFGSSGEGSFNDVTRDPSKKGWREL